MKELNFTDNIIINSAEIQSWLEQFNKEIRDREIAINILKQLRFVTISDFRIFIKESLTNLINSMSEERAKLAIYPIMKLDTTYSNLWMIDSDNKDNFIIRDRKPKGRGSEDLVINIIYDLCKSDNSFLLETPDIETLKKYRVKDIIFVVDNSISGEQVNKYLDEFFNNKTIKSYWSLNYFRITILSLYLSELAKSTIKCNKFIAEKVKKEQPYVFFEYLFGEEEWNDFDNIIDLVSRYTQIPKKYRFGYNGSASNVIFEHSVPNNVFGIFYCKSKNKWNPLFKDKRVSNNLIKMLKNEDPPNFSEISKSHLKVLYFIHNKCNTLKKISIKIGFSEKYTRVLCEWLIKIKFITLTDVKKLYKLTPSGKAYLINKTVIDTIDSFDFGIYTPRNMEGHNQFLFSELQEDFFL